MYLVLSHLVAVYLFAAGFLLSRLALTDHSTSSHPGTHKRAVVLIVDALRFDFLSPDVGTSPHHHDVFTLPAQLASERPNHALLFNAHADPPTTTLQRIKAITTGSLPTFVDLGSNFGASSISEDSLLLQISLANKTAAFMGDDTWMSVFPTAFAPNLSFPFDSFNVEDLHTVDNGVITHLFPLLNDPSKPFDVLIGHFLGVDHVGHRVSPDHPSMHAKLSQMNDVLSRVVDAIDDETLLVVLGDHGMDKAGDHGGDGVLETSSALWFYSKSIPLTDSEEPIPSGLVHFTTFPGATKRHRRVQQIDLVPTLSLLLGLPIPFNNLGTVIPELFWRPPHPSIPPTHNANGRTLESALEVNAQQIMRYLDTYRRSPHGSELDSAWSRITQAYKLTQDPSYTLDQRWVTLTNFTRVALGACRAMWAQFNPTLMGMGLSLLAFSLCATWSLYGGVKQRAGSAGGGYDAWLQDINQQQLKGLLGGLAIGGVVHYAATALLPFSIPLRPWDTPLYLAGLFINGITILLSPPTIFTSFSTSFKRSGVLKSIPFLLILHTLSFLSNSFTFWEDRLVPFFLVSSMVPYLITAFESPVPRLRNRTLGYMLLFCACVRVLSGIRVCREEQQPYCSVTFFQSVVNSGSNADGVSGGGAEPPRLILLILLPTAFLVPWVLNRFLGITKSQGGVARVILWFFVAPSLVLGGLGWVLEVVESRRDLGLAGLEHEDGWLSLRGLRTMVGIAGFAWTIVGMAIWWIFPVCLDVKLASSSPNSAETSTNSAKVKPTSQITILGFSNPYGAPMLVFFALALALVWPFLQPTGQVALAVGCVAFLSFLEVLDSTKDSEEVRRTVEGAFMAPSSSTSSPSSLPANLPPHAYTYPSPSTLTPLYLLSLQLFYATGHQATLPSLQWKTAFVLSGTVRYPWSPLGVVLNTLGAGPLLVGGLGAGVVAAWCVIASPNNSNGQNPPPELQKKKVAERNDTSHSSPLALPLMLTTLSAQIHALMLLLGASTSAAILRRHLMVWKVFAPRYMLGVVVLLAVDAGLVLGGGAAAFGLAGTGAGGALGRAERRVGALLRKVGFGADGVIGSRKGQK